MASVTFQGNTVTTKGQLPEVGTSAPDFTLVKADLGEVTLSELAGENVVLNIFPSIDTGTCAMSVRKFNEEAQAWLQELRAGAYIEQLDNNEGADDERS